MVQNQMAQTTQAHFLMDAFQQTSSSPPFLLGTVTPHPTLFRPAQFWLYVVKNN